MNKRYFAFVALLGLLLIASTAWALIGSGESPLYALNTILTGIGFGVSPPFSLNTLAPPLVPDHLVIQRDPDAVRLHWNRVAGTGILYNVYSDSTANGAFNTLLATLADTAFIDSTGATVKFYLVKAVR
jgi:hypothetical protein